MKRVGFVGWRGMVGSVLMDRMRDENDFANIDEPDAVSALAGNLGDSSSEVRFAAETVLGSLGDIGVDAVEPLLRAQRERTVQSALRVVATARTAAGRLVLKGELRHRARELWHAET